MSGLAWTWKEAWEWFQNSSDLQKRHFITELGKNFANIVEVQVEILEEVPEDLRKYIISPPHLYLPILNDTVSILQSKWSQKTVPNHSVVSLISGMRKR